MQLVESQTAYAAANYASHLEIDNSRYAQYLEAQKRM